MMMIGILRLWWWWLLLLLLSITLTRAERVGVGSLPNLQEPVCWHQESGYLPGHVPSHELFYWYHEAVSEPDDKPLVLWLNGGPGCSSLGGMFTELGPFVLDDNLHVTLNPYSFNRVANIIFIEQPVGVGFSYPNVPANDTSTAVDTVAALRAFLSLHPELQGRAVYVMGESYGGHYVPNTVHQIQVTNRHSCCHNETTKINIRGFGVGNGYTDWQLDFNANVENGRYHALTSQSAMETARDVCQGDYARCFWPRDDVECPDDCELAVDAATFHAMDNTIDIYDIYNDVCLQPSQQRLETQLTTLLGHRREAIRRKHREENIHSASTINSRTSRRHRQLRATISPIFPTCIDAFTDMYLNLPNVQKAIHVRPETIPNGKWSDCGNVDYTFNYESMLDKYKHWTTQDNDDDNNKEGEKGLQILIYNGDADYILSHMGNSAWINQGLQLPKIQDWTPWRGSDGQVAGYLERYQTVPHGGSFTFLTVKGAGHMVPRDRPRHALDMFAKFITDGKYEEVKRAPEQPLCPKR
eukprot:scaffold3396_cov176-Amphora_coffeaeformis.AAC.4